MLVEKIQLTWYVVSYADDRAQYHRIIVLEDGEIADIGTHEELIKKEGYYSNVWTLQQMIEEVQE